MDWTTAITDDLGLFDPIKAAKAFGFFVRFKGGGGAKPPNSNIADTPTAQWARQNLYPVYNRALEGKGFTTPALDRVRQNAAYGGLLQSFLEGRSELERTMERVINPNDLGVKQHLLDLYNRNYQSGKDALRRGFKAEKLSDKDQAFGMAAGAIGNEMRMGIANMQAYNNALQTQMAQEAQYGTMMTNIAGGLGYALPSFYYAKKMGG